MMATTKAKTPQLKGPQQIGEPQGAPNTEPYDLDLDRLTGGLHGSISKLTLVTGEVRASIIALQTSVSEIKTDIKTLDASVNALKTEQAVTARSIAILRWIAAPMLGLTAIFAPYAWNSMMRPDIERTIAASVKADIEKEQAAREKTALLEKKILELEAQLKSKGK